MVINTFSVLKQRWHSLFEKTPIYPRIVDWHFLAEHFLWVYWFLDLGLGILNGCYFVFQGKAKRKKKQRNLLTREGGRHSVVGYLYPACYCKFIFKSLLLYLLIVWIPFGVLGAISNCSCNITVCLWKYWDLLSSKDMQIVTAYSVISISNDF